MGYLQCGGNGWGGPKCCVPGNTCQELNPYYFQCLPGTSPPTPAPVTPAPTPAPTPMTTTPASTSTPQVGECRSFCAQSSDTWSFKCSWDCCTGCPPCTATTTTTTPIPAGRRLAVTTQ